MGDKPIYGTAKLESSVKPGGMKNEEPRLGVKRVYQNDKCRIYLEGELRLGNSEQLVELTQEAFQSGCREVILDFSKVTYCDTSGLQCLVMIFKYVKESGTLDFCIFVPDGTILDTLRISGFDKFIKITSREADLGEGWDTA